MAHNKLTQVPRDIPKESVNIFLQKNKISTIVDYTFIDNMDCEDLKLDYNKLEKITYKMLKGLYSLKWLDLSKKLYQTNRTQGICRLYKLASFILG